MRRLVNMLLREMSHSGLAVERHKKKPEHVKRCHPGNRRTDQPQQNVSLLARKGFPQDFIFREETRQTWGSRDSESSDKHRPERHRNLVLQPAHLPHIL